MLYISAQPDNSYFLWQLKVMLCNFKLVGISSNQIQILLSYDPKKGINPVFLAFEKQNHYGQLHFYADERVSPKYRSSIRPHILAKHFKKYPSLSTKTIFYHDCDIIFRKRLNKMLFKKDEKCYVSDASTYMNLKYINKFDGALQKMVATVGIDELLITQNDAHTGGAQYVLKSISVPFWEKLESDSEVLFSVMTAFNEGREKPQQIQACCADMWALYWGLLKAGKKVKIHKELDFCWPKNELTRWDETKILHNAGVGSEDKLAFCKGHFTQTDPFFRALDKVPKHLCSIKYIEQIKKYEQQIIREALKNLTFILPLNNNTNASKKIQKEVQQNIINLLSEELERQHIVHTPTELVIHAALSFNLGAKFFSIGNRRAELGDWLDKVFANPNFNKNHSKQKLAKIKKHLLVAYCGVDIKNSETSVKILKSKDKLANLPLVSVVVPCYNAQGYLKECIESILKQSYNNFELILVNDGSTDDTENIIKAVNDPRIVYHTNRQNIGIAKSLNKGINLAKGKYIARMDADDVMHPERLAKQFYFMERNLDYGLIGSWHNLSHTNGMPFRQIERLENDADLQLAMLFYNPISHPTVMMRSELAKANPYCVKASRCEDYELWFRLAKQTKIYNLPQALVNYRVHPQATTAQHQKEMQQQVMELLSNELEKLGIAHTPQELLLHCAIGFGLGAKFFSIGNRKEELGNWLNKLFANPNFNKNHSKQNLAKMRKHILVDCCWG